jgi:hypothetical protein
MAHRQHHHVVDEQAEHDRGCGQQDVVDEAQEEREAGVTAVLGEVRAREYSDRCSDRDRERSHHQASEDGVEETAHFARRRCRLGENGEIDPGESLVQQRAENDAQPAEAEQGRCDREPEENPAPDAPAQITPVHVRPPARRSRA